MLGTLGMLAMLGILLSNTPLLVLLVCTVCAIFVYGMLFHRRRHETLCRRRAVFDAHAYDVLDLPGAQQAADTLAILRLFMGEAVNYVQQHYGGDQNGDRRTRDMAAQLVAHRSVPLVEGGASAVVYDSGRRPVLRLALRQDGRVRPSRVSFVPLNVMKHVVIVLLARLSCASEPSHAEFIARRDVLMRSLDRAGIYMWDVN